jgi:hypothetical protein
MSAQRLRESAEAVPPQHVPMTAVDTNGSVPSLLSRLANDGQMLVREEVELAKAEMSEKMSVFAKASGTMAAGSALLIAAVLLVAWAANVGLTALLVNVGVDPEMAVWLAPLILAALSALVGWGMVKGAQRRIKKEGFTPRLTTKSIREDTAWAQQTVKRVGEEVRHGQA